jgi:hypothetical protein
MAEDVMADDIMAADVIITSAAPTITIRILVLLFAGNAASLDRTRQLANHICFD